MWKMGSNSSKKAPEEEAREDSSTDLEEEEDKNSAIENENVPATGQVEEQDGNDEKWWDQPVAKEKKRSSMKTHLILKKVTKL